MAQETFSRSCYATDADLYKAKADYFEKENKKLVAVLEKISKLRGNCNYSQDDYMTDLNECLSLSENALNS